jgi:DNA-binding MarR family transcriptional regulator
VAEASILHLMRLALRGFVKSIDEELTANGIESLPRNGGFVIEQLAAGGGATEELIRGLGVSKQAVSRLIDVLVERDFLVRAVDPSDRRRTVLALTRKGQTTARAIAAGTQRVEERLRVSLTEDEMNRMRTALTALADITDADTVDVLD